MTAPSPRAWAFTAKVSARGARDTQVCSVLPTGCLPGVSTRELSEMFPFDFILCIFFSFLQLELLAAPGQAGSGQGMPRQW